jgi:hypothetical protein
LYIDKNTLSSHVEPTSPETITPLETQHAGHHDFDLDHLKPSTPDNLRLDHDPNHALVGKGLDPSQRAWIWPGMDRIPNIRSGFGSCGRGWAGSWTDGRGWAETWTYNQDPAILAETTALLE